MISKDNLIACAVSFVSFVLPKIKVDEIILFGSTTRGEAGKKSDIDIFFNTREKEAPIKKIIKNELKKFYKSNIYEAFKLRGISNEINIEVGNLENWHLKRSIIADGIVLYGRYKEIPKNVKSYIFYNIKPIKNIAKRNKIIRVLFGRKEINYAKEGIIQKNSGKIISPSSFILPIESSLEITKFLQSEKIDFISFELWTDNI